MADRTFASLVARIQPSAPGCPYATIVQYVRDAAIRTCERTLFWRYQIPVFNLLPGVFEYVYEKPANTDVHAIFEAIVNKRPCERLTLDKALEVYPQWGEVYSGEELWSATPPASTLNTPTYNSVLFNANSTYTLPDSIAENAGTPQAITQVTPDKFLILPSPNTDMPYTMRMFVALKPTRTATGMDSVIFDELEEAITHGALQYLLLVPDVTWSDKDLAVYHARQYTYQCAERRARANIGNARGAVRARMQPFGA